MCKEPERTGTPRGPPRPPWVENGAPPDHMNFLKVALDVVKNHNNVGIEDLLCGGIFDDSGVLEYEALEVITPQGTRKEGR